MSRELPFPGLSSLLNKISQKAFQQYAISNQQEYWSVVNFVHLQLLKKPTKNYNNPKIIEKADN